MKTTSLINRRCFAALLLSAAVLTGGVASADDFDDDDDDHEKAYFLRDKGEFKPLQEILKTLQNELPEGHEILSMELEREDGVWVYEFRIIDQHGQRYEVCADAASGEILGREGEHDACSGGRGRSKDRKGYQPGSFGSRLYRGDRDKR